MWFHTNGKIFDPFDEKMPYQISTFKMWFLLIKNQQITFQIRSSIKLSNSLIDVCIFLKKIYLLTQIIIVNELNYRT